jgi:hypothetical protein
MRYLVLPALVLSVLLVQPEAAFAQGARKIKIEKVQVGFPKTVEASFYKAAAWTPVYVYLTNEGSESIDGKDYALVVETTDSEDVQNHYTERRLLPLLNPGESTEKPLLAYVRPGGDTSEITVHVQNSEGRIIDSKKPDPYAAEALPANAQIVLLAGSKLHGMKSALIHKENAKPGEAEEDEDTLDAKGPLRFVYVEKVEQLPARWFGYQGVDLMVLTTAREEFISNLLTDPTGRKEALVEWVHRGGRLVISAGRNQLFVKNFLEKTQLLKCDLTGTVQRRELAGVRSWVGKQPPIFRGTPIKGKQDQYLDVEFTELVPGPGVDVLAREVANDKDKKERPSIVQAGCGLGRVVLTAFDLDAPPFTSWGGKEEFWKKLAEEMDIRQVTHKEAAPNPNQGQIKGQPPPQKFTGEAREPGELASELQNSLEDFDKVPVINFGWVALFIAFYIILVGPIDYFVLKKLVKRLELTWVTFPAAVLTISGIAYFTAYWLKGNDLRINKIDVVDIDLNSSRAYGSTWFTIYSPRIQNYTVGLEAAPERWNWRPPGKVEATGDSAVLVDWMGRPEADWERRSQQGILNWNRPTYRYAADAAGLESVPIRVWATKSFSASWWMALTEEKPLFEAELHRVNPNSDLLEGTITSHLPVDLKEVTLIYKGLAYEVKEGLNRDEPKNINGLKLGEKGSNRKQWFDARFNEPGWRGGASKTRTRNGQADVVRPARFHMKSLLFHSAGTEATTERNSQLRALDESWRLNETHREEVILVGRTAYVEGEAEDVSKNEVSPSRLWLGVLPDSGKGRKDLDGKLSQETFVRVYIPITLRDR